MFDATVEEVLFEDGEDVGMGGVVIRFSPDDIQTQLTELEQQLNGGLLDGVDEETKEALERTIPAAQTGGGQRELTAQTSWRKVQALVSPGDRVTVGRRFSRHCRYRQGLSGLGHVCQRRYLF